MKTLHKIPTFDIEVERKWLKSSPQRCRSTQLFYRSHTPKELYSYLGDDTPNSLEEIIAETEAIMLAKGFAEWVVVAKTRKLKVCDRIIDWGIKVVERLGEDRMIQLYRGISIIEEIDTWKRISLEFGRAEYEALLRKIS
jgi:hypothetical protein